MHRWRISNRKSCLPSKSLDVTADNHQQSGRIPRLAIVQQQFNEQSRKIKTREETEQRNTNAGKKTNFAGDIFI